MFISPYKTAINLEATITKTLPEGKADVYYRLVRVLCLFNPKQSFICFLENSKCRVHRKIVA